MDIELIADIAPNNLPFAQGAEQIIALMRALQNTSVLSNGWRDGSGSWLADDEAAFIDRAKAQVGEDGLEIGMYQLWADGGLYKRADGVEAERSLFGAQFGHNTLLPPHVNLGLPAQTATLALFKQVIGVMLEWSTIQHVKICDPWYAMEDAPLDARRRGIGWAGWVPFALNAGDLPEATLVETLGHGTFLASSPTWDVSQAATIKRAQNLELSLNALGVLPTFEDLATGAWGVT